MIASKWNSERMIKFISHQNIKGPILLPFSRCFLLQNHSIRQNHSRRQELSPGFVADVHHLRMR